MTTTEPRTGQRRIDTHSIVAGAAQTPSNSHSSNDAQSMAAVVGPHSLVDHEPAETQRGCVDEAQTSDEETAYLLRSPVNAHRLLAALDRLEGDTSSQTPEEAIRATASNACSPVRAPNPATDYSILDAQVADVGGGPTSRVICPECRQERSLRSDGRIRKHRFPGEPTGVNCGGSLTLPSTSPTATADTLPTRKSPSGISNSVTDHMRPATHGACVGDAPTRPAPAKGRPTPTDGTPVLDDPALLLAADVLDDLEGVRIANENRLRQMTRATTDKDGEDRGLGYDATHPDVLRLAALIQAMCCKSTPVVALLGKKPGGQGCCLEHDAERQLTSMLEKHPLFSWVKRTRGVGEKQAARLLATIGDPFWNDLHNRPRLVSELWSFCGYGDAVKQVRRKGEKSNWSPEAKMRAHMVAKSTMKQLVKPCYGVYDLTVTPKKYLREVHVEGCECSPYRLIYGEIRAKYADAVHDRPCVRCAPKGKPAPVGSPISAKHNEARALRAMCKELLRDLWREARRLHELPGDQSCSEIHQTPVVGVSNSSAGQATHGNQSSFASGGPT